MLDKDLMRSVTDAAVELCCGNAGLKERLAFSVRALNVALIRAEDWPGLLRRRAQEISEALHGHPTLEQTVGAMDPQAARRLAERILQLYADCHAVSSADPP